MALLMPSVPPGRAMSWSIRAILRWQWEKQTHLNAIKELNVGRHVDVQ
jgi:hypothetical protein